MRAWAIATILVATLAGCSDDNAPDGGALDVSADTGGIRGVVVDSTITPIAEARIVIKETGEEATSAADGTFRFTGLDPGTYFVEASKPLYDTAQRQVTVTAGDATPDIVKIQLTRVIADEPYLLTDKYEGYITCSVNLVVVLSEECGEGLGVPCDVPAVGCQRVGGQENNRAQIDFTVDGPSIKTLIVEQVWTPSTSVGVPGAQSGGFYTVVATEWSCLPVCDGHDLGSANGGSPLLIRVGEEALAGAELTSDTVISSFTWASTEETGVLLNQAFELFVSASYVLPAPEGWSFVGGSEDPFGN